jgi:small redox-active disulfide protein 2
LKEEVGMKTIQVLGPGCSNCQTLAKRAEEAVRELGIECEVEKITDINAITGYGIMLTPALVINGEVKMSGKVPSTEQIKSLLTED